jgi:hypothetical protein
LVLRLFCISRYWEQGWQPELLPCTEKHRIAKRLALSPSWNMGFFKAWLILKHKVFLTKWKFLKILSVKINSKYQGKIIWGL